MRRPARPYPCALVLTACACAEAPEPPRESPGHPSPRVLLVTVDTLRADALGCYGNEDARTPALDRLASEGILFERAYSQATITHPSLSSLLTGLLPTRHGVSGQASRMHEGVLSVAPLARAAGVPTASFVANLCKLQSQPGTVFHDGWDVAFCGMDAGPEQYQWDEAVVTEALSWLARQEGPFFCWVHLMDPHAEHRPPPDLWDYAERPVPPKLEQYELFGAYEETRTFPPEDVQEELLALYAAEVEGADRQVGRLLDYAREHPAGDSLSVVLASDHGEELFETWSRYDHGLSMTEGVLWVPLIVRAPRHGPGRVSDPVELLAVAPTLLELLDLTPPYDLDAPSLLDAAERDFALSFAGDVSVSLRTRDERYWLRRTAEPYVRPHDQFPWRADAPWFEERECLAAYDTQVPTQVDWRDLSLPENRARAEVLRAEMERYAKELEQKHARPIDDPALLRQLRELGYVDGEL